MKNKLKNCWDKILEFLFPSNLKCVFCGRDVPSKDFCCCEDCLHTLPFNNGQRCKICDDEICGDGNICDNCKSHHKKFDKAIAPLVYEGDVKKIVLKFKNDNAKYLAPHMAKFMLNRLKQETVSFDLILPVPLSEKSLDKRKYNQASLLAEEIAKLTNSAFNNAVLIKEKETKHQKELGFLDRQNNLHNAFKVVDKNAIINKNILLVDDVMTTGATANECAKTLKKYASKVYVLTFARNKLTKK